MAKQAKTAMRARLLLTTALGVATLLPAEAFAQTATLPSVLFSTGKRIGGAALRTGEQIVGDVEIVGGITQLRTGDGDLISIVGNTRLSSDNGEVALQQGRFTVVAGPDGAANVRVAGGMLINITGKNASANFSIDAAGFLTGRGLGGGISVTAGGMTRSYGVGEAFRAAADRAPTRTLAVGAQPVSAASALPIVYPLPGFDATQNPSLRTVASSAPLDLLQQALAASRQPGGFAFDSVSDAFKTASLTSVGNGDALGYFNALTALGRAQSLTAQAQAGTIDASNAAYLASLLAYFRADGLAGSVTDAQRSQIAAYDALIAAGSTSTGLSSNAIAASYAAYARFLAAGGIAADYTGSPAALLAAQRAIIEAFGLPDSVAAADRAAIAALLQPAPPAPTPPPPPPPPAPQPPSMPAEYSTAQFTGSLSLLGNMGTVAPLNLVVNERGEVAGVPSLAPGGFSYFNATLKDAQSGPGWLIGRYSNGTLPGAFPGSLAYTSDLAFHYGLLTGAIATVYPTSGTATYGLAGFTTPSFGIDSSYPSVDTVTNATLYGGIALSFGSAPKVGFDGTLLLSRLGTPLRYDFTSPGGLAAPSIQLFNPGYVSGAAPIFSDDALCAGGEGCEFRVMLGRGGPAGSLLAGTYGIARVDKGGLILATGAAVYVDGSPVTVAPGTRLTGVVTPPPPPPPPTPPPPPPPPPPPVTTTAVYSGGGFGDAGPITVTLDAAGAATKFGSTSLGTVRLIDGQTGSNWLLGRYADGTTSQTFGGTTTTQTYGVNDGVAFAYATAVPTALPTSGLATFGIAGFTTPTFADNSAVTGASLTGGFAVAFGSMPKFGAAGILTLTNAGAQRYEYQTTGGLAAPSLAMFANGTTLFPSGSASVTTTDSRCASNCKIFLNISTGGTTSDVLAGTYALGTLSASGAAFGRLLGGAVVATTGTAVGATPVPPPPPPPPPVPPAGIVATTPGVSSALATGDYVTVWTGNASAREATSQINATRTVRFTAGGAPVNVRADLTTGDKRGQESASTADWILARFGYGRPGNPTTGALIGSPNFDSWYVEVMKPITTPIPTSGRAEYSLTSFTLPTSLSGDSITAATLAGRISIVLAGGMFGMDATLDVTRPSNTAAEKYQIGSAGAFDRADSSVFVRDASGLLISNAGVATTGTNCTPACTTAIAMRAGGSDGQYLGGSYTINNNTSPELTSLLFGGAMFTQSGRTVPPAPPSPPPATKTYTAADLTVGSYYGSTAIMRGAGGNSIGVGQLLSVGIDDQGVARGYGDTPQFIFSGEARDLQSSTTMGSSWRIGRLSSGAYTNGTISTQYSANQAYFYGLTQQIPSFVPTTGTASFGLKAYTPPAFGSGAVVTDATLYGGITIKFAATPLFGIEGALLLKEDGNPRRYDFASLGGLANPSTVVSNRNGTRALDANAVVTSTDPRCVGGSCTFTTGLALGGATGTILVGTYGVIAGSGAFVGGAAVYEDGAPVTTAPALGGTPGYTMLGYSNIAPGTQSGVTILRNAGGGIDGYRTATTQTERGTATNSDSGNLADIIGWTRWVSGTTQSTASQNARTLDANNGGIIWAKPATNLPTSGTASYAFAGGTAPSFGTRLGVLDGGQLAVAFDTLKVGMEARVLDGADIYTVASTGGVAAPSMALDTATMRFAAGGSGASVSGGACATAVCSLRLNGTLAGDGANNAAVAFTFGTGTVGTPVNANGVIAFTKTP